MVRYTVLCTLCLWAFPPFTPALAQELASAQAGSVPAASIDLHLEVFVNGVSTQKIAHVRQTAQGQFLIEPGQLRSLGLLSVSSALQPDGWIAMAQLPGVQVRYEETAQTLYVQAQDAAMVVRVLNAQTLQRPPDGEGDAVDPPSSFGGFLNHTLYVYTGGDGWSGLRRYQTASGLLEANVYGAFGTLTSTHLVNAQRDSGSRFRSVRLDTQWAWFDEQRLMTISAGDFVSSSLPWSRAVRLGGIQIRRNFAIRPDLITMPMLSGFSGSAAVPSTVELYVNDAQRFSQDVAPGPFAIDNLPLITGSGTARMVVRDALGRETVSELPFYASSELLAKGLSDFSFEAGFARRNYGALSQDYGGRLLSSATVRYGLSDTVTLEGHAQAGGRLALAGAGGVFQVGTLGVTALAGSVSRYSAGATRETGSQLTASLEAEAGGLRLFARSQRTFGAFNDLASTTLDLRYGAESAALARRSARPPRRMNQVSLSFPRWNTPSINLSYTEIVPNVGERSRLLGINLGQNLGRNGYISLSAYRDMTRAKSLSVFAMASWFFDNSINASSSVSWSQGNQATTTAELSRSERSETDSFAWRLRAARGQSRTQGASASYRSRAGRIEAAVERMAHGTNGRMQVDGAVVFAGGGVFLANRIYDAFGVVNVGAPNVQVRYENVPIAKTDASGQVLLPTLRSYDRNLISIDPISLPVDARIPVLRQTVRPRWRSGVVVDFGVALQTRVALVTLHDEAGAVIAMGAEIQLNDGASAIVGYDGQVWLENIRIHNRLVVKQAEQPDCVVEFTAPQTMRERLRIPDAVCRSL